MLGVPWVPTRALQRRARVAVPPAARELDHRKLRREDTAALLQLRDDRRVLSDDLVAVGRCAPRRRGASSGEQVLRAVWDSRERPALLFRESVIGALGLVERALRHEGGDCVVLRSELAKKFE